MLIRIVKMHFRDEAVKEFLTIFNNSKHKIRSFQGCSHLELFQDYSNQKLLHYLQLLEGRGSVEQLSVFRLVC